ncbi:S-adenosyl-L-methionine-dependent methyltransferase [Lasiosphaeria hispida]|uniref:S-adenosyl-L-methionine-dependent methyltransferase n=1 Tax=Lasiosphaeria hispida TaxID=260671 RepID=A0AAJ0HXJ6_9PEZI|nr:S-adenosyl-L-methionine-dependent methyltransferase [Lasiosphaeria hispida]
MSVEQNKEFFNNEAASYDARHEKTLTQLVEEIRSRLDFIGVDWVDDSDDDGDEEGGKNEESITKKGVRLLDYACGTGLVSRVSHIPSIAGASSRSLLPPIPRHQNNHTIPTTPHPLITILINIHPQALAPYTTQCVGIDLSENMVAAYNTRAENQGLTPSEMHAYQGNLLSPAPSPTLTPPFTNFTLAAVGLGFHHFDDPSLAARRLVERLAPGGVLMIIDFLPHDKMESTHAASHTVTHHGFSEAEVRRMFEDAGAGEGFRLEEVGVVFNRAVAGGHGQAHGEGHAHGHDEHGEGHGHGHSQRPHPGGEVRRRVFIARGAKGV